MKREIGNDVLQVQDLGHSTEDKIILLGDELAKSALLLILAEKEEPNEGQYVGVLLQHLPTSRFITQNNFRVL